MFAERFVPNPELVTPSAFEGHYTLYHDGWYGTLRLEHESDGRFSGSYHSVRFKRRYAVSAEIDKEQYHKIRISFLDFTQILQTPNQEFVGFIFTHNLNCIAGLTTARDVPFGFFARKTGPMYLSDMGDGSEKTSPSDFAGHYTLYHDGLQADVALTCLDNEQLCGSYQWGVTRSRRDLEVQINENFPHEIKMVSRTKDGQPVVLTGYLFTRPKNGIAGFVEYEEKLSGFYMTKFSNDEVSTHSL